MSLLRYAVVIGYNSQAIEDSFINRKIERVIPSEKDEKRAAFKRMTAHKPIQRGKENL